MKFQKSIIRNKIKEIELNKKLENVNLKEDDLKKILINYFSKFNINSEIELENFFTQKKINKNILKKNFTEILWNEYIFVKYSKISKSIKNKSEMNLKIKNTI